MLDQYFALGCSEVVNRCRTSAYAANGVRPPRARVVGCGCEGLCSALELDGEDVGYTLPSDAGNEAPWYDPAEPASGDFAGLLVTSVTGFSDSPLTRTVRGAVGGGGVLGRERLNPRTIRVVGWLIARTCCGGEYGMRWLSQALRGCGPTSCGDNACGGDTLETYTCCPETPSEDDHFDCDGYVGPDYGTLQEQVDRYSRCLRNVGVVGGPTVLQRVGTGCSDCGGGCAYQQVEFTLVAAEPWLYRSVPTTVVEDRPFVTNDDPTECVEWCSLNVAVTNWTTDWQPCDEYNTSPPLNGGADGWDVYAGNPQFQTCASVPASRRPTVRLSNGAAPVDAIRSLDATLRADTTYRVTFPYRPFPPRDDDGNIITAAGTLEVDVRDAADTTTVASLLVPSHLGAGNAELEFQPPADGDYFLRITITDHAGLATQWFLDATLRATGTLPDDECSCDLAHTCDPNDPCDVNDPACDAVTPDPPAYPSVEADCGCDPFVRVGECFDVAEDTTREWFETVPVVEVFSGSRALRNFRVRFLPNGGGRDCDDLDDENECAPCTEANVSYIPPNSTLRLDGVTREVTIECPGGATAVPPYVTGADGGPFDWPAVLTCGNAYCVCVSADGIADGGPADDATVSVALVGREF